MVELATDEQTVAVELAAQPARLAYHPVAAGQKATAELAAQPACPEIAHHLAQLAHLARLAHHHHHLAADGQTAHQARLEIAHHQARPGHDHHLAPRRPDPQQRF